MTDNRLPGGLEAVGRGQHTSRRCCGHGSPFSRENINRRNLEILGAWPKPSCDSATANDRVNRPSPGLLPSRFSSIPLPP